MPVADQAATMAVEILAGDLGVPVTKLSEATSLTKSTSVA